MSQTVAIVGGSGYTGGELIRWVMAHPELELQWVTSRKLAGTPVATHHPGLLGFCDLTFTDFDATTVASADIVFLATPHGASAPLVPELADAKVIVDLSRDHRHAPGWVYGQPEHNREALLGAQRIAAPGCFATALMLSIAPFVAADVVAGDVQVSAATGSTGSGVTASATTHHPTRMHNLKAYKVLSHQHVPEVLSLLGMLGAAPRVHFVPHSAPVDRGIFATSFIPLRPGVDAASLLGEAYAQRPAVRVRGGSPELRFVRGTALADIAVHQTGDLAVVLCAIDNLGKGASAQAVQALNLAMHWPELTGLTSLPLLP